MVGCSALGCANASVKGKKMFRFPWNEALKRKWAVAVKRATATGELWIPNVGARLCQDHFVTGAPSKDPQHVDYVPSLFRYNERTTEATRKRQESYARHASLEKKREFARQQQPTSCAQGTTTDQTADEAINSPGDDSSHDIQDDEDELPSYIHTTSNARSAEVQTDADTAVCDSCQRLKEEVRKLNRTIEELKRESTRHVERQDRNVVKHMSEAKVQFYTGLPKVVFFAILSSIVPVLPTARKKFPHDLQLLSFLMKLRLNVPFRDLAYRFSLDARTVSQSFRTVLDIMSHLCKDLIKFPSREVCESWLTEKELKHFPRLRAIIDCTEVHVARPLNLDEQQVVWSTYKQNTTLKYLVAVNPHGAVMFVSKTSGGRISDKELTLSSGFMQHLESGDQVLADRGFLLFEEFYERNVQLITPSFVKSRVQLPGQEVTTSRRISSSRIIVERAIGHIKKWRIMTDTVQHSLVDIYDEITFVVAGLTNMCPPLSKKGEASPTDMENQLEQHCQN